MKQFLLTISLISIALVSNAQQDVSRAIKLLEQNKAAIGLSDEDLSNSIVNDTYFNKYAATTMVYLQQSYLGLPVYNIMQVLAFRDDKLVSAAGKRISDIQQKLAALPMAPSITPEQAIRTAFFSKKISIPALPKAITKGTKMDYGKLGISHENVTTELMWVPSSNGKEIRMAWQVYVVPVNSSDYWLLRIDAHTNKLIGENNLTVYCNWDSKEHQHASACMNADANASLHTATKSALSPASPNLVGTATYLVIPFPAESRLHPGGTPAVVTNPWLLAGGNAATLGWHNDGTTDYLTTRGNNVFAQEDRDNANSTFGLPAFSATGPDPLSFEFTPNFTITPTQTSPVPNQQFNTTNLFYWNNIIHDLTYNYGFDEAAGNFQNSNMGRGGAGNDFVVADAQDAGGTNNANFSTPPDGQNGRMQMYLWNGTPQRDGDADNGVMVHEYGHGISNRLTGGPSNSSCLGNAEQMGEGWSDYYSLMYTQNWANSTLTTGFTTPRGIGTYLAGQGPTGQGIRTQRYCTNFAINNKVFLAVLPTIPHDRGEIWCAALWDMTWNIINQVGAINPNIFNNAGAGGNTIALKLVTEAMKLQPCNPGFISGRDAILQADRLLYGGLYACSIKEAFRKRGMGAFASQGSSDELADQTPDYSGGINLSLTQGGITTVPEGNNIVYNNNVSVECIAVANYTLRDTLPGNVTFVNATNGGTYDAATRVVSWNISQAANSSQVYSFTVNVNAGSYFAPTTFLNDAVTGTSIPATWITTATPVANVWTVSSTVSSSAPNSYFVQNLTVAADQKLELAAPITFAAATSPRMTFKHKFNTEENWDGGVVEISTNNGSTWVDLGYNMVNNGYNGNLGSAATNALGGRPAFTGTVASFFTTAIDLSSYAGQTVKIRFRFASDNNTAGPSNPSGWWIDDINITTNALVRMRSALFNNSNNQVRISDTITLITQANVCNSVAITTQPSNQTGCANSDVTFSVAASGTNPGYQWQVSNDGGNSWNNISGAISSSYTVTGITAAMNNWRYRVLLTNTCPSNVTSNSAILTISSAALVTTPPSNTTVCPGSDATFSVSASGTNLTYQWQSSTNGGTTWSNISGATANSLTVNAVTTAMNNNQYRAVVFSCGPTGVNSAAGTLTLTPTQNINSNPVNSSVCPGTNAQFSVAATGAGVNYQWQRSTDGGNTYTDISGATGTDLTVSAVTPSMNNYKYRALVKSTCTPSGSPSTAAILTVLEPVLITRMPVNGDGCIGRNMEFSIAASGSALTYQWQISTTGTSGPFINLADNATYSGTVSNTLSITDLTLNMSGNLLRVIVTGAPCGNVVSDVVTLSVSDVPGVVISPSGATQVAPGIPGQLVATPSPAGTYIYQWFRDGLALPNTNNNTYILRPDGYGLYTATVTDVRGCSATSNLVTITTAAFNNLFIYPNPNNGIFQIRYYSDPNATELRLVNIFDSKGSRVFSKLFTIARTYQEMDVNLSGLSAGVYMVELIGTNLKRIASAKVIVK